MADSPQIEATARALRSRILVYNDYGRGDVRVHEFGRRYAGGPARVYYYFDRLGGPDQSGHYQMALAPSPPPSAVKPKRGLLTTLGTLFVDTDDDRDYEGLRESFSTGLMFRGL
eukprot:jgi/Mesvir1/13217/Mv06173-RA.1